MTPLGDPRRLRRRLDRFDSIDRRERLRTTSRDVTFHSQRAFDDESAFVCSRTPCEKRDVVEREERESVDRREPFTREQAMCDVRRSRVAGANANANASWESRRGRRDGDTALARTAGGGLGDETRKRKGRRGASERASEARTRTDDERARVGPAIGVRAVGDIRVYEMFWDIVRARRERSRGGGGGGGGVFGGGGGGCCN